MLTKNQSTDKQKEGHKREKIKEKAINILIYALIVSICCSIAKSCIFSSKTFHLFQIYAKEWGGWII